jgi:hypothetical protein
MNSANNKRVELISDVNARIARSVFLQQQIEKLQRENDGEREAIKAALGELEITDHVTPDRHQAVIVESEVYAWNVESLKLVLSRKRVRRDVPAQSGEWRAAQVVRLGRKLRRRREGKEMFQEIEPRIAASACSGRAGKSLKRSAGETPALFPARRSNNDAQGRDERWNGRSGQKLFSRSIACMPSRSIAAR